MIKLNEYFTIETDAYNFTLKFEKPTGNINKRTGKEEVSKNEWYYPKLYMALEKFSNESLKIPSDVQGLINEIKSLKEIINRVATP